MSKQGQQTMLNGEMKMLRVEHRYPRPGRHFDRYVRFRDESRAGATHRRSERMLPAQAELYHGPAASVESQGDFPLGAPALSLEDPKCPASVEHLGQAAYYRSTSMNLHDRRYPHLLAKRVQLMGHHDYDSWPSPMKRCKHSWEVASP